ncbi:MAG: exodeoxyribonuclease VII large subunit [Nitrospira sp. BO4]|jgi:exodeoxyribonuclease VII large subunit|nr:exodeoxyribonuclease VII large subunit [Nitrospira sp. BO4]
MVRASLETDFPEVWLEGEISNLRAPGSGHVYCTLKDQSSQVRVVLFRSVAIRLRFDLEDGLHVVVRGRLSVYEPRGEYQVILDHLEPKGRGALQLAFEQLKHRLESEGLFDGKRKRALPVFPWTVGIVTSLTGAAVRDLITVLHRRCPILRIVIAPVQVQGAGSAEQIASAIHALNKLGFIDVMIVGRGGGSMEDLWSFNEEVVVRAIATSRIPIVSAVGHETDVTLADFAADVRAPTPSAAAETVAPVLAEVVACLSRLTTQCRQAISSQCLEHNQRLDLLLAHLVNIRFRILKEAQRVDGAVVGMREAVRAQLKEAMASAQAWTHVLMSKSPAIQVRRDMVIIPQLRSRLMGAVSHGLKWRAQQVHAYLGRLNGSSPLAILDRGYGILETAQGRRVIRDARQVSVGEEILARLARGRLRCTVEEVTPDPSV